MRIFKTYFIEFCRTLENELICVIKETPEQLVNRM